MVATPLNFITQLLQLVRFYNIRNLVVSTMYTTERFFYNTRILVLAHVFKQFTCKHGKRSFF